MKERPLSELVRVNRRYHRSIRVDTDWNQANSLEGFICAPSVASAMQDMAHQLRNSSQAAFTWTGPYGSGKSSLAVALAALVAGDKKTRHKAAELLGKETAAALRQAFEINRREWVVATATGRRASLLEITTEALVNAGVIRVGDEQDWTEATLLRRLQARIQKKSNGAGLLIILDELGKAVEHAVTTSGDLHLLQQLAEISARSNGTLVLIGILHQGFSEYAESSRKSLGDELAKVQGRFADIVLSATQYEQLGLIASALEVEPLSVAPPKHGIVTVVKNVSRQRKLSERDVTALLQKCWPLNPVVAVLLPALARRRFGQNQRSIFSFLTSAEPLGFSEFIATHSESQTYDAPRLWAYLRANLEPAILASADGHKWATAVDSVERAGALHGTVAANVLKSLALIEMVRESTGMTATPATIAVASGIGEETCASTIASLVAAGLVVNRKHLGYYTLASGSDFNIEEAVKAARPLLHERAFQIAQRHRPQRPLLAKRFYHETGSLFWARVRFIGTDELDSGDALDSTCLGDIAVLLPESSSEPIDAATVQDKIERNPRWLAIGTSKNAVRFSEVLQEVAAIELVAETRPEPRVDAVARREVDARLRQAHERLDAALDDLMSSTVWYRKGGAPKRLNSRELTSFVSDQAAEQYPHAPRWPNELLQRVKPSSSAVAALRNLLYGLVQREGEPLLGLEGYSAERGLFESLVSAAGLYRLTAEGWAIVPPTEADPCKLSPAFVAARRLLEDAAGNLSLSRLYDIWQARPFGVKQGALPLLAFLFVLSHRDQLAWYRGGSFQTRISDLDVDLVLQDAGQIGIRWVAERKGSGDSEAIADALWQRGILPKGETSPLRIARALVAAYDSLPAWTRRTSSLSVGAAKLRQALKNASDPHELLFRDVPSVLTVNSQSGNASVREQLQQLLDELSNQYPTRLELFHQQLLRELDSDGDPELIRARARQLQGATGDLRLSAFAARLAVFSGRQEDVEGIVSLAINKSTKDWGDTDLAQAHIELADLCQKFLRAELYQRIDGRAPQRVAIGVLVGDGRKSPARLMEVELSKADGDAVHRVADQLERLLRSTPMGRSVAVAALAEVANRIAGDIDEAREDEH